MTTENENEAVNSESEQQVADAMAEAAAEANAESMNEGGVDVAALQEEVAELKDRLLRSHAELENYRRRVQKEATEAAKYSSLPFIRDLLPGVDNLSRAVDAAEQSGDTANLIQGVKMVAAQFADVLKNQKIESISPEGEQFDPNLHEALTQIPSADHEPMTVLQVIETGYQLHDRVIRPAKVMVSCAPPEPAPEAETEGE
ncbi:UNVERIFIED_CONTAM: hypothetical protein GTU68_022859 [Idotea baltica]|nr:hypothetical protein [Idotea baltica]